jgi:hypothetical protein
LAAKKKAAPSEERPFLLSVARPFQISANRTR